VAELRNVRVVSPLETARRRARDDPRWQAAWAQLVAPDRENETARSAYQRRADALNRLHGVETFYQVAAGIPPGI
jgi:hypothetical protein